MKTGDKSVNSLSATDGTREWHSNMVESIARYKNQSLYLAPASIYVGECRKRCLPLVSKCKFELNFTVYFFYLFIFSFAFFPLPQSHRHFSPTKSHVRRLCEPKRNQETEKTVHEFSDATASNGLFAANERKDTRYVGM